MNKILFNLMLEIVTELSRKTNKQSSEIIVTIKFRGIKLVSNKVTLILFLV